MLKFFTHWRSRRGVLFASYLASGLLLCLFGGGLLLASSALTPLPPTLLERMSAAYGNEAQQRLLAWQQLLLQQREADEWHQLQHINHFLNQVPFVSDAQHWRKEDYWATPAEFLASNGGDCEDFSIAKLFSLQTAQVPTHKLRLMYVNALSINEPHMVLIYTEKKGAAPLVLDNLTNEILPANLRTDLEPIYSFNNNGLWLTNRQKPDEQVRNHSGSMLWEDLIARIKQEGFL